MLLIIKPLRDGQRNNFLILGKKKQEWERG